NLSRSGQLLMPDQLSRHSNPKVKSKPIDHESRNAGTNKYFYAFSPPYLAPRKMVANKNHP
ncbi:MAG: hypothetical protein WAT37_15365, partial [Saprospiraceae bacterium]